MGPAHAKRISRGSAWCMRDSSCSASSARILRAYSSTRRTACPRWSPDMSARARPFGDARLSARPGPLTMSPSDCAAMTVRALPLAQALDEGARQVLLRGEHPQPALRPRRHVGGIGPEEGWRHGHGLPGHQGEVEREVMALEPPAPWRARAGRAEHGEGVVVGIAHQAEGLEAAQHLLEAEYVHGLAVAHAAQARLHELVGRGAGLL